MSRRTWIGLGVWLSFSSRLVMAQEAAVVSKAAEEVRVGFPLDGRVLPPGRFYAPPIRVSADSGNKVEFSLLPASPKEELFITLVFRDSEAAALRVHWLDVHDGQKILLSEKLTEGVTGFNQRTLRVPKQLLAHAGQLVISGQTDDLRQISFQWMEVSPVFLAKDSELATLIMNGRILRADEMEGGQNLAPPDAWFNSVLDASLQDHPETLDGGLEFIAPLSQIPERILLRAKFLNLAFEQKVNVWINGEFVGELLPVIPPLTDPGYGEGKGAPAYAGWREGSLLLPVNQFLAGENSIIFKSSEVGVFVKDAGLQLKVRPEPKQTIKNDSLPAGQLPGSEGSLLSFP